jgi:hypothetical membrane protein
MAGAMLFIAAAIALMGIITAETLYPGYSTADNMVSDLGATEPPNSIIVQPPSNIFSASMFICGTLVLIATFMVQQTFHRKIVTVPLAIFGLGILGVGIFNGSWGSIHATFAMMAFMGGGISAIVSYKVLVGPYRYISVVLGVTALLVLFSYIFMGEDSPFAVFGLGGLERWIVYPVILWTIGFGGHLMGQGQMVTPRA